VRVQQLPVFRSQSTASPERSRMPNVDLTISHRDNVSRTRQAMLSAAEQWKGTAYLLGGNSTEGVDCSHFVYQVLNSARRTVATAGPIPQLVDYRSTTTIEVSGAFYPVPIPEPGDLVLWDGHVGIVISPQRGTFIGAQTSTGVAEASYTTGYWAKRAGLRFLRFANFF
jgi:cell wall-associated NlpC family hydrolase